MLCFVTQLCPTLCGPWTVALWVPLSMGILQARILKWVAMPSSRESSQPRDWTWVSCIAGRFLPSEPPGKPMNTGVGGLSLLQGIFLTQESNRVLLHRRQILYQLSYRGSPRLTVTTEITTTQHGTHCSSLTHQHGPGANLSSPGILNVSQLCNISLTWHCLVTWIHRQDKWKTPLGQ